MTNDMIFSFATAVLAIVILIVIWMRYGRPYTPKFDAEYYRELPAEYSPAEMATLYRDYLEYSDLTATLLDLTRRGYLIISPMANSEGPQDCNYAFTLRAQANGLSFKKRVGVYPDKKDWKMSQDQSRPDKLSKHELQLLEFLFSKVSDGEDSFSLDQLENFAHTRYEEFDLFWSLWQDGLYQIAKAHGFRNENDLNGALTGAVLGVISAATGALCFVFQEKYPFLQLPYFMITSIICGILLFFIPIFMNRRSPSGQEDLARWKAFRNFLRDFSNLKDYDIPSLAIWEHYLVYATSLGIASKVIEQLVIVLPKMKDINLDPKHPIKIYSAIPIDTFANCLNRIDYIVGRSISYAKKELKQEYSRSKSSGRGHGGGFSSGGGSGGGGGGGGFR
jgi:uncharacterized membrane protein